MGEIRDVTRYTYAQARARPTANMHYGPWDEAEQAAGSRFVQATLSSE